MATEPGNRDILVFLQHRIPAFYYAYTHSPQFKMGVDNAIQLFVMQIELMSIGAESKQAQFDRDVRDLGRRIPEPMFFTKAQAEKLLGPAGKSHDG